MFASKDDTQWTHKSLQCFWRLSLLGIAASLRLSKVFKNNFSFWPELTLFLDEQLTPFFSFTWFFFSFTLWMEFTIMFKFVFLSVFHWATFVMNGLKRIFFARDSWDKDLQRYTDVIVLVLRNRQLWFRFCCWSWSEKFNYDALIWETCVFLHHFSLFLK